LRSRPVLFPGPGFLKALLAACFLVTGTAASSQDSILNSYQRNFMRASLSTKAGILLDAATDDRASEFIGQLYEYALNFSLQNAEVLRGDPDLLNLTIIAVRGAGSGSHVRSVDTLWNVFNGFRDSHVRIAALDALAVLAGGNARILEHLNQFLANQNSLYRSNMDVDIPTISACINALGTLGDESSFPVLFAAVIAGYPEPLGTQAAEALEKLPGDIKANLTEILRKNPPVEKLAVFRAAVSSRGMSDAEKGAFAQTALEIGMERDSAVNGGEAALALLCSLAVQTLRDLKWTRADPAALRYFYLVQSEYQENRTPQRRDALLEAISCLAVMDSPDAAQSLSLQLGYLNSQFERTSKDGSSGESDESLVLGVINALGQLGDRIAFDNLHYVGYLDYPERVKAAAREALNNLKW
jgi:HEAT repeat protein